MGKMHSETNQGALNCDEMGHEVPTNTDLDNTEVRNSFHEEFEFADNELSDDDEELPIYHDEEFINPAFDVNALNFDDLDEEQISETHNIYEFVYSDDDESSSSSETSNENQEDQQEIVETRNEDHDTSNTPDNFDEQLEEHLNNSLVRAMRQLQASIAYINSTARTNINNTQQGASNNTENDVVNNIQEDKLSNLDVGIMNNNDKKKLNNTQDGTSCNEDCKDVNNIQEYASNNCDVRITNGHKKSNINSTKQGVSCHSDSEELKNIQEGAISNLDESITTEDDITNLDSIQQSASNYSDSNIKAGALSQQGKICTNYIDPNLFVDDSAELVFVECDDESSDEITINETSESPESLSFDPFNYDGPGNSGF